MTMAFPTTGLDLAAGPLGMMIYFIFALSLVPALTEGLISILIMSYPFQLLPIWSFCDVLSFKFSFIVTFVDKKKDQIDLEGGKSCESVYEEGITYFGEQVYTTKLKIVKGFQISSPSGFPET